MAQTGFTPIITYHSTTASAVPTAGNLSPGELALNINDMKLYCENSSGVVTLLASAAGSSGDVVGPASSTDNAVVRFDGTTGKLVQNSGVLIADDGTTVISVNSATDALRITQVGAGNALLVEDSANPDATPFVVNADGNVGIGVGVTTGYVLNVGRTSRHAGFANRNEVIFQRANNTEGSPTVLAADNEIINLSFQGYDGTNYLQAARILAVVDGTPGTNDMPGRLVFSTTADGASSPTERMRINSSGQVGVGATPATGETIRVGKNLTGNTSTFGVYQVGAVQSDVTTAAWGFRNLATTAAASFTLSNYFGFQAVQGTIGAGSTVTNQYGFHAESSLTGATNNFGFYSNIASGSNRWNFYANGTADNYFAGRVGIGSTSLTTTNLRVQNNVTGGTIAEMVYAAGTIQSDVTSTARYYRTFGTTAAASFTLGSLIHYGAEQGTIGATSAVTNQYGFIVESSLTGATNNYGFYSNIASGTGRWNFYANGTAENFFGGVTTFRAANAVRVEAAATQDAVVIAGRAGGTGSFAITLTPATLSASRTLTLPEPGENVTLGYLNIPQNSQSTAYTLVATDAGKQIFHPSADTTARIYTIPANSSVAYPIGTAITFINQNGAGVVTIAITSDTMRLAGAGTTGSRTLAANGIATCIKVTSTEWIISGTGLT